MTKSKGYIIHTIHNSEPVVTHDVISLGSDTETSDDLVLYIGGPGDSTYFRTDDADVIRLIRDGATTALENIRAAKVALFEADRAEREEVILAEYNDVSVRLLAVRAEEFAG